MQNLIKTEYYSSPIGELILGSFNDKLCLCDWRYRKKRTSIDSRLKNRTNADYIEQSSNIITETIAQLTQYFKGNKIKFNIPLLLIGTDFQKEVWGALQEIPYGKTNTYLRLAKELKNEKAIRAIASANGANAISIIVPCHRIIGSNGGMVGYAGGLEAKMKLLKLENALVGNQLSLF
ncbi:MAG: cysteine methyltransferase [Bacteroidetes bacterium]|nr:cysteine methyltransferase [Bacteroidota bacterium]